MSNAFPRLTAVVVVVLCGLITATCGGSAKLSKDDPAVLQISGPQQTINKPTYLAFVDIESGQVRSVAHSAPNNIISMAYSPHGFTFAYSLDGAGTFIADLEGKNVRKISDASLTTFAWSPDGKYLLIPTPRGASGMRAVEVLEAESGKLVGTADNATAPSWSPDGTHVALGMSRGDDSGKLDLGIWKPFGDNPPTILDSRVDPRVVWSPDGKRLAWRLSDTASHIVKVADLEGDSVQTIQLAGMPFELAWSGGGKLLAINASVGENIVLSIYDTSDFHQVATVAGVEEIAPNPVQDEFAVIGNYCDSFDAFTVTATGMTQISKSGMSWDPLWSPSGTNLAFGSFQPNGEPGWSLSIWDEESQTLKSMVSASDPGGGLTPWSWSSDGRTLLLRVTGKGRCEGGGPQHTVFTAN